MRTVKEKAEREEGRKKQEAGESKTDKKKNRGIEENKQKMN
jgi:hypothetical protein